ncbi:hypothetical protein ACFL6C_09855 [Myxococcota bacterium]
MKEVQGKSYQLTDFKREVETGRTPLGDIRAEELPLLFDDVTLPLDQVHKGIPANENSDTPRQPIFVASPEPRFCRVDVDLPEGDDMLSAAEVQRILDIKQDVMGLCRRVEIPDNITLALREHERRPAANGLLDVQLGVYNGVRLDLPREEALEQSLPLAAHELAHTVFWANLARVDPIYARVLRYGRATASDRLKERRLSDQLSAIKIAAGRAPDPGELIAIKRLEARVTEVHRRIAAALAADAEYPLTDYERAIVDSCQKVMEEANRECLRLSGRPAKEMDLIDFDAIGEAHSDALDDLEVRYVEAHDQLVRLEKLDVDSELREAKHRCKPYNELFADMVAVLQAGRPDAIAIPVARMSEQPLNEADKLSIQIRDFATRDVPWTGKPPSIHAVLTTARLHIGENYMSRPGFFDDELAKQALIKVVLDACLAEHQEKWMVLEPAFHAYRDHEQLSQDLIARIELGAQDEMSLQSNT